MIIGLLVAKWHAFDLFVSGFDFMEAEQFLVFLKIGIFDVIAAITNLQN